MPDGAQVTRGIGRPRWAVIGLIAYVVAVAVVVFAPVSYSSITAAIAHWLGDALGVPAFGAGWVEFTGNVLMFVPLGLLLTVLLRRHWKGAALALVLSIGVELAQVLLPARTPSVRDVLANALGAAIGASLAWVIVSRAERRHRRTDRT